MKKLRPHQLFYSRENPRYQTMANRGLANPRFIEAMITEIPSLCLRGPSAYHFLSSPQFRRMAIDPIAMRQIALSPRVFFQPFMPTIHGSIPKPTGHLCHGTMNTIGGLSASEQQALENYRYRTISQNNANATLAAGLNGTNNLNGFGASSGFYGQNNAGHAGSLNGSGANGANGTGGLNSPVASNGFHRTNGVGRAGPLIDAGARSAKDAEGLNGTGASKMNSVRMVRAILVL